MRDRGTWTPAKLEKLERIINIVNGLTRFWPLTLRQVYYQLVSKQIIDNNVREYKKLSALLSHARIENLFPWRCLEDRTRETLWSGGWPYMSIFIQDQLTEFLSGYRRNLLQEQEIRPEIWVEKDALSRLCHAAAFEYCVPVIVAKGFSSVSYLNEAAKRIRKRGAITAVLYFGDMTQAAMRCFRQCGQRSLTKWA